MITNMLSSTTIAARAIQQNINYVDVLIVGGGLSGMMVAHELEKLRQQQQHQSWNYTLVEARTVLGGRLINDNKHDDIDLGGAWFWPPEQELVSRLVQDLDISTFEQPPVNPFMSTKRFQGGAVQLVRQMAKNIPNDRLFLNTPVTLCRKEILLENDQDEPNDDQQCPTDNNNNNHDNTVIRVETSINPTNQDDNDNNNQESSPSSPLIFWANHVIFCVPPKLLSTHVIFDPPLSSDKQRAMQQSNTWMAGVTKVALVYERAFWKDDYRFQNILGRLAGPAFQLYDSSTDQVSALTAFALDRTTIPSSNNDNNGDNNNNDRVLADRVAGQLSQAFQFLQSSDFAKKARMYTEYHIQRWPLEKYISEDPNPTTIQPHPYPVKALSTKEWDGRLLFAGTETDVNSPGVMEGAIGSALRCVEELTSSKTL